MLNLTKLNHNSITYATSKYYSNHSICSQILQANVLMHLS